MQNQQSFKSTQAKNEPWYKVGMVWVIIALPLIVVVASMVTITIAHQNAPQVIKVAD